MSLFRATKSKLRSGEVVSHQAHNLKNGCSNHPSATAKGWPNVGIGRQETLKQFWPLWSWRFELSLGYFLKNNLAICFSYFYKWLLLVRIQALGFSPEVFRKQFSKFYASIIQLVECLICNQVVIGSSPVRSSLKLIIIKQDFA